MEAPKPLGLSLGFSRVLGGSYCAGPGESTYGGDGAEVGAEVREAEPEVEGEVRRRGSGGVKDKGLGQGQAQDRAFL